MSDKITKIKIDGNIYTIDLDRSDTGIRESLVDILKVLQGVETDLPEGLISKNDKIKLDTIWAAFDDSEDSDSIVNKIKEVLKVFENYPEATNLIAKLNSIDETIAGLDLAQVGTDGSYIKTVKQENGQVSATKQAFDTTIPATGNNPSNINAPTTKAVRDAINALDVSSVGSDGGYIKTISETDGKISAARQAFATSVGADGDDTNAPTTKAVRDAIKALDVSEVGSDGNYIKKVSETDGKVSITKQAFDTTVNSSSTDNNAPTSKAVNTAITNAINALDVTEVGEDGSYIKKVSEADGKVSITKQAFDTSVSSSSTDNNAPTSKAVHTAITGAINALDVSNITANLGTRKTITALSETDGKISATAENISIASSQINDKTNSYSETGETAVTGKAIKAAIDGLTDTLTGEPSTSKTLTAFDEVGGKVTATFSNIAIAESQVTNLVTDLSNKADLVDGLVPAAQLPSYVDDVIEFAKQVNGATWKEDTLATTAGTRVWNAAAASQIPGGTSSPYYKKFLINTDGTEAGLVPETPEAGKIYVGMTDTNCYRWSGSNLVEISKSLALGETSTTAYAGNKGKANAEAIAALQTSVVHNTGNETIAGTKTFTNSIYFKDGTTSSDNTNIEINGSDSNAYIKITGGNTDSQYFKIGALVRDNPGGTTTLTLPTKTGTLAITDEVVAKYTSSSGNGTIYGVNASGSQEMLNRDRTDGTAMGSQGYVVMRIQNGQIQVPVTPTDDKHAASKKYVDTYAGKIDKIQINGVDQTITNKVVNLPTIPTKATDVNQYGDYFISPTQVRQFQATTGIVPDLLHNINGHDLSGTYTTTSVTIDGKSGYKILNGGEPLSFNDAHNYMRKMTGSEFTPIFNDGTVPQYSYIIAADGTIYKPQYDSTNGLVLYTTSKLALYDNVVRTSGTQTIAGTKTFSGTLKASNGLFIGSTNTIKSITFNSSDSGHIMQAKSIVVTPMTDNSANHTLYLPAETGILVAAEKFSSSDIGFNKNLRAFGIFSRGNTWDEDAGEPTDNPVAGLYFDEGVAPVIYNEAREIDLSGWEGRDDSDVTISWPEKISDNQINIAIPNKSGTIAIDSEVLHVGTSSSSVAENIYGTKGFNNDIGVWVRKSNADASTSGKDSLLLAYNAIRNYGSNLNGGVKLVFPSNIAANTTCTVTLPSKTGTLATTDDVSAISGVNNGTLTFTRNGSIVGTFTANSSTNTTVSLSPGHHFHFILSANQDVDDCYASIMVIYASGDSETFSATVNSQNDLTINEQNVVAYILLSKSIANYGSMSTFGESGWVQIGSTVREVDTGSDFLSMQVNTSRVLLTDFYLRCTLEGN